MLPNLLLLGFNSACAKEDNLYKIACLSCAELPHHLYCICSIRMIGSAALSMCMVACGSVDGYFEYGIHCWDIAAGDIIVREAGGVTLYPTGI